MTVRKHDTARHDMKQQASTWCCIVARKWHKRCVVKFEINMSTKHTRFVLTDACFEHDTTGGIGGVLCGPMGCVEEWFHFKLEREDVIPFMNEGQENAIAELETLAVVVAMKLMASKLCSQHVVFCLDNDVSRFGLNKSILQCNGRYKACETCLSAVWRISGVTMVFACRLSFKCSWLPFTS